MYNIMRSMCVNKMSINKMSTMRSMSHCHRKQRSFNVIDIKEPRSKDVFDEALKNNNNVVICDPNIYLNQHPLKGYKWDEGNIYSRRMYSWHLNRHNKNVLEKWPLLIGETVCNDNDTGLDAKKNQVKKFDEKYDAVITSIRFNDNEEIESEIKQFWNTIRKINEDKQRLVVITDNKKMFSDLINSEINQDSEISKEKLQKIFKD